MQDTGSRLLRGTLIACASISVCNPSRAGGCTALSKDKANQLIGQSLDDKTRTEVLRKSGATNLYVVPLGSGAIVNQRNDRVLVQVDQDKRIISIQCE
jgi:hypothetical protein